MNSPRIDSDQLLGLAADYLHATGTPADAERLEQILRTDPGARRLFVDYCMLHGQLALTTAAHGRTPKLARASGRHRSARLTGFGGAASAVAGLALAAACLAVMVGTPRERPVPVARAGSYDNRQLPLVTVASVRDAGAPPRLLTPTTLRPEMPTALQSASGADVKLSEATVFGMTATDAGTLFDGSVKARLTKPRSSFSITTSNLRIVDKGTDFAVERIDEDHVTVTVIDGEVEVQSRVRLPVCYWPFDVVDSGTLTSRMADVVSGLTATLGDGVTPAAGLVGTGAVRFDDTPAAVAAIEGGTGEMVGTGLLAMAEGITIEAVIVSAWSGAPMDYDEIYRKEDGVYRVLLSFQNDGTRNAMHSEPVVPPGPCLSFGLHLAGHRYSELDMPLDGRDGRPTVAEITDGRPHHVVATYDSFSGRKAIFIDGTLRYEHLYPEGMLVLGGGPAVAEIGNTQTSEPFHGVIDEFALYDFALSPDEVAEHHRRVVAGDNYFDSAAPVAGGPRWQAVTRLVEGETMTFNRHTGLPR